jgi:hypothetical protein
MKLFSKTLNHKKTILFVFLFVCILLSPKIVFGADPQCNPGCVYTPGGLPSGGTCVCGEGIIRSIELPLSETAIKCPNFLADPTGATYCGVFTSLADTIDAIFYKISYTVSWLFSTILTWTTDQPITKSLKAGDSASTFIAGWAQVRDFANMLIVLGFVVVGISFTLRIEGYGTKKVLINLILVALLVNFSGLFCGIMIDAANITIKTLKVYGGVNGHGGIDMVTALKKADNAAAKIAFDSNGTTGYILSILWFCVFYAIVGFTYFVLGLILIERYAILAILYILSPAAFVFWVFPASKKLWTEWWNHFLKWCFVGVMALFFMGIATKILNAADNYEWITLIVVLVFMVVGAKTAVKSSGMASAAVIGLAASGAGFAMGAVAGGAKGTLKALSDKTGVTGAATRAKDRVTQGLENVGLRKTGGTSFNQQSRLNDKDRTNRVNSMSADQMVREIQNPRFGNQAFLDRAKMMEKLGENNQLGMLPAGIRANRIAEATTAGVRAKSLISGLGSGDIANIVNNPVAHPEYDAEARAKGTKALMERGDLHRVDVGQRARVAGEVAQHGITIGDLAKSHYEFRNYDQGPNGRAAPAGSNPNAIGQDQARVEQLRSVYSAMGGTQRRNIAPRDITPEFITSKGINADNLSDFRTAGNAQRVQFGNIVSHTIDPAVDRALRAAETAAAGNTKELNRVRGIREEIVNHIIA